MTTDERITASAGADLFSRRKLPANEDAAATAIAAHADAYAEGRAWFPLLSDSEAAALFQRDDLQLGGLGSSLKKALKKVKKVAKAAVPLAVGIGAGFATGSPQVGIAAMNLTGSLTAKAPTASGGADPVQNFVPAQQAAPVAPVGERMIAGIPERYLPWIGLGLVAVMALRR